jgi:hypothetical protein
MSVEPITNGGESPCTVADYRGTDRENKETGRIRQAQGNVATLSGGAELAKLTATDRATKAVAIESTGRGPDYCKIALISQVLSAMASFPRWRVPA